MKIIIFEFLVLIKYFLFVISILGILVLAHRKILVQANAYSIYKVRKPGMTKLGQGVRG